jgi:hypothetical protein
MQGVKCDGFLVKTIDKHQLLTWVEQLVRSQPQGLLGKNNAMDRLGLGPAEYNDLVRTFADQLAAILPIVVLEQGESDEPISESLGRLLKELAESASMLGADTFVRLYATCTERGMPARSQCPALLKALQELEEALLAYLRSQSHEARGTECNTIGPDGLGCCDAKKTYRHMSAEDRDTLSLDLAQSRLTLPLN